MSTQLKFKVFALALLLSSPVIRANEVAAAANAATSANTSTALANLGSAMSSAASDASKAVEKVADNAGKVAGDAGKVAGEVAKVADGKLAALVKYIQELSVVKYAESTRIYGASSDLVKHVYNANKKRKAAYATAAVLVAYALKKVKDTYYQGRKVSFFGYKPFAPAAKKGN